MSKRLNDLLANVKLSGLLKCVTAVAIALILLCCADVAHAEENYCEVFNSADISNFHQYHTWGNYYPDGFTTDVIVFYTYKKHFDNDKYLSDPDMMEFKISAAEFEKTAKTHFTFKSIQDSEYYDAASDSYIILGFGGAGGAGTYNLVGYTSDGKDEYTLYFKHCMPNWSDTSKEAVSMFREWTGTELSDSELKKAVYEFTNGKYAVSLENENSPDLKFRVKYDGKNVIFLSSEKAESIPATKDLITWSTKFEKPTTTEKETTTEVPTTEVPSTKETTTVFEEITMPSTGDSSSDGTNNGSDETTSPSEDTTEEETTNLVIYEVVQGVKVEGGSSFAENTVVKVEQPTEGKHYEKVEKALAEVVEEDKFVVFEITATLDNAKVQPNGKVKIEFDMPKTLSSKNLKMFYISDDGKKEEIKIDVKGDKITAELTHFSTYVLCNVKPESNNTAFIIIAALLVAIAAGAGVTVFVLNKKKTAGQTVA